MVADMSMPSTVSGDVDGIRDRALLAAGTPAKQTKKFSHNRVLGSVKPGPDDFKPGSLSFDRGANPSATQEVVR
jgi:hypothetical protein